MSHRTMEEARSKPHEHAAKIMRSAGYKVGGKVDAGDKKAVSEHETHMHKGEPKTFKGYRKGGPVGGKGAKHNAGHAKRGGNHVHINIIPQASSADKQMAAQQGLKQGMMMGAKAAAQHISGGPMAPPPPMPMPPRPMSPRPMAGGPPGAGPIPPGPGGPPMGLRRGGRADGGAMDDDDAEPLRNTGPSSQASKGPVRTRMGKGVGPNETNQDMETRKRGGHVKKYEYGGVIETDSEDRPGRDKVKGPRPPEGTRGKGFKAGGGVGLTGGYGSGSGEGRLAKAVGYGHGHIAVKAHLRKRPGGK